MTYQDVIQGIEQLSKRERVSLIKWLITDLDEPEETVQQYDLLAFEGVGAHLADAEDPQDHIRQLRSEWDHR